jgi:hypothetical protein
MQHRTCTTMAATALGIISGTAMASPTMQSFDVGANHGATPVSFNLNGGSIAGGPAVPAAIDLGVIGNPGRSTGGVLGPGQIVWYSFTIAPVTAPSGFLTIDTLGSQLSPFNDTEIGLYNSLGTLIAFNDDGVSVTLSRLAFGSAGTAGNLAGGTYYLAVGGFNTNFGPGFAATSTSTLTGTYSVNFSTNVVPSPAGAALLAVAGLVGARRRRVA